MKAIWKFKLNVTDKQEVEMPKEATILCVDTQAEMLCLWAIVDPEAAKEKRAIAIVGTGHAMPQETLSYIGTAQMSGGALIWHVFEVVK